MTAKPKVVVATAVLLTGVVGAFWFRKAPSPTAGDPASPVVESAAAPPVAVGVDLDPTPHLLGRIDPVDATDPAYSTGGAGPQGNEFRPSGQRPGLHDPYSEMPTVPPWSGFDDDHHAIEARKASLRSSSMNGLGDSLEESRPKPRRTHKVSDGDTLSSLALRYLGRSDRYHELYLANQHVLSSPDVLPIGSVLTIPPPESQAAPLSPGPMVDIPVEKLRAARGASIKATPTAAAQSYRVQAQDTLSSIARQFYGDATRYRDVLEANRDKLQHPEDLREGMTLIIP